MLRNSIVSITATVALAMGVARLPRATHAGYVTVYDSSHFGGDPDVTEVDIYGDYGRCFTFECTNDRASSADWSDFPPLFGMDVYVWFFTDANCQGRHRVWPGRDVWGNFPNNFAIDGIDKAVSSFLVSHTADVWNGYAVSCPDMEAPNKESSSLKLALLAKNNTTNATETP